MFKRPVYFGLFFAFIWEGFIGSIPGSIGHYTFKHFIRSIGAAWIDYGELANYDAASTGSAALTLIAITIGCLLLGALLFRENEYP